jgi:hypothetical protein
MKKKVGGFTVYSIFQQKISVNKFISYGNSKIVPPTVIVMRSFFALISVVLLLLAVGGRNCMIRRIGVRQTINHVSILRSDHGYV